MATSQLLSFSPFPYSCLNPFSSYVVNELNNRESNIGMDASTISNNYLSPYKGPTSAWARVASFSSYKNMNGFIMHGVNGFDDTFGFYGTSDRAANQGSPILGYALDGVTPHILPTTALTLKNRPSPGVNSVEVSLPNGVYRKVNINWTCWSSDQLDYMEKFFMIPGMHIIAEWGWNNYNPGSLLDLNSYNGSQVSKYSFSSTGDQVKTQGRGMAGILTDDSLTENDISISNGNYDRTIGIISNFDYKINKLGGFDVNTEILSKSSLYSGLTTNQSITVNGIVKQSFKEFLKQQLPRVLDDFKSQSKPPIVFKNSDELNQMYGGIEKRVFVGGGAGTTPSFYTWDFGNTSTFYVTFGVIIDMINLYLDTNKTNNSRAKFNIGDSWISGHPNLKSCDGTILLIPNQAAPIWTTNTSNQITNIDPNLLAPNLLSNTPSSLNSVLSSANTLYNQAFNYIQSQTVPRQDLTQIICTARGGPAVSFPRYAQATANGITVNPNGYAGKLMDLYVSSDAIVSTFEDNDKILDGLNALLDKISDAACGIWSFMIKPVGNIGNNNDILTIIDTNFCGFKSIDTLYNDNKNHNIGYNFKLSTSDSIIQDAGFDCKLSDSVALQTIFNSVTNTNGQGIITQISPIISSPSIGSLGGAASVVLGNRNNTTPSNNVTIINKSIVTIPFNDVIDLLAPTGYQSDNPDLPTSPKDSSSPAYPAQSALTESDYFFVNAGGLYSLAEPKENASFIKGITQFSLVTPIQHTGIMPGTKLNLTIMGMSGIKFLDVFTCTGLPSRYSNGCIFQVIDINHKIDKNIWTTSIIAGVRPALGALSNI